MSDETDTDTEPIEAQQPGGPGFNERVQGRIDELVDSIEAPKNDAELKRMVATIEAVSRLHNIQTQERYAQRERENPFIEAMPMPSDSDIYNAVVRETKRRKKAKKK